MIKKIKIKNIVLLLSLLMMTGCDFMDCDESDNFTKQEVLDSYNRVKQLATNVWFLKSGLLFYRWGHAGCGYG